MAIKIRWAFCKGRVLTLARRRCTSFVSHQTTNPAVWRLARALVTPVMLAQNASELVVNGHEDR
eukprot:2667238-Karenia_brevis.AAC.1